MFINIKYMGTFFVAKNNKITSYNYELIRVTDRIHKKEGFSNY